MTVQSTTCGVCGNLVLLDALVGLDDRIADLEGRPEGCDAASLATWIAECSACGYVGNLGSLSGNEDHPEELARLVSRGLLHV